MSLERNKAAIRAFVDAVNQRDWERLDELVSPGFVRHSRAAPRVSTLDELKRYLRSEFEIFPDAVETIEDLVAEGDRVAVRHLFTGTQLGPMGPYPASGRVMEAQYLAIYRLSNGLVAESWAEWDNLDGLAQLGHYPGP